MSMKIVKIIDIPIYNTSVCFMIGDITKEDLDILRQDNPDKIDEVLYKHFCNDFFDNDRCDGLTTTVADGTYLIFVRSGFEFNPRVVFHELFHLTNYILCDRGVEHNETAEAWAYLLGWIAEGYYNIINQHDNGTMEE